LLALAVDAHGDGIRFLLAPAELGWAVRAVEHYASLQAETRGMSCS
jgi:hypothetical protein